ncbi:hypothetical protein [Palleronia abyssalis]|uniref:Uncharacterized protein n=1 Tax=Palleronia abyssalis TaxID=1501240 RepID=A0A2R8C239_9RHOB|nr:hypothetical protein [Palleronia abyssalis]SPJ26475.1 hypothetical protein PAA8504_04337 [Palleronia abyssalis]
MTSPSDANENCFLCDAWAYLSSDDMVLNLTSEMIGIIATLVLITMLGGRFVRRAAAKSFDRKWAAFRADTAASILESQKQLDDDYFYLGHEMLRVPRNLRNKLARKISKRFGENGQLVSPEAVSLHQYSNELISHSENLMSLRLRSLSQRCERKF